MSSEGTGLDRGPDAGDHVPDEATIEIAVPAAIAGSDGAAGSVEASVAEASVVEASVEPVLGPPGSGADLTADAMVRSRVDRPQTGWRAAMFTASRGLLNPGVGPDEHAHREQVRRIRRQLGSAHQIGVTSINGGVGKTTVAACVGLVLAEHRGDRVVALDASPNAGTLADRLTGDTSMTVRDMLGQVESLSSLADVTRYTSLAGRLQVLASEQDPAMSEGLARAEYESVCEVLRRFFNVVITDSGSGLVHSAVGGTLALADSLVIVGSPTADGASRANKTLDWLLVRGYAERVADAVLVLTCDRASKHIDTERVRRHFEARCRAVVEVPFDPHLATGARIDLDRIRPPVSDAFHAIAAHLTDGFDATPVGVGAKMVAPDVVG